MELTKNQPKRVISVFVLAMLNVSIMASLRNLPLVAEFGLSAIVFFAIVALFFLVPCALVSAELATGWPKSGGVYIWVREGPGGQMGVFRHLDAVGSQCRLVPGDHVLCRRDPGPRPLSLSSSKQGLYPICHSDRILGNDLIELSWNQNIGLVQHNWGYRRHNFTRNSHHFPGRNMDYIWESGPNTPYFPGHPSRLHPTRQLVFLSGLFLAFAGLEVSSAYAGNVQNPQKNYPRAILLSAAIVFSIFMLGSLAIAVVIPKAQINLVSGLMEAFGSFSASTTWNGSYRSLGFYSSSGPLQRSIRGLSALLKVFMKHRSMATSLPFFKTSTNTAPPPIFFSCKRSLFHLQPAYSYSCRLSVAPFGF